MKYLALSIPGFGGNRITFSGPSGLPIGGLSTSGSDIVNWVINIFFIVAVITALIFIIYSGIEWIISGGDKQKVQAARKRLVYAVIGLIIVAGAFFIVSSVISILGGNPNFYKLNSNNNVPQASGSQPSLQNSSPNPS